MSGHTTLLKTKCERLEREIEKFLDGFFSMKSNMGDTFAFACADAGEVEDCDGYRLFCLYRRYGWPAVVAYEAFRRGCEPLESRRDSAYLDAKREIGRLYEAGEIMLEKKWNEDQADG